MKPRNPGFFPNPPLWKHCDRWKLISSPIMPLWKKKIGVLMNIWTDQHTCSWKSNKYTHILSLSVSYSHTHAHAQSINRCRWLFIRIEAELPTESKSNTTEICLILSPCRERWMWNIEYLIRWDRIKMTAGVCLEVMIISLEKKNHSESYFAVSLCCSKMCLSQNPVFRNHLLKSVFALLPTSF